MYTANVVCQHGGTTVDAGSSVKGTGHKLDYLFTTPSSLDYTRQQNHKCAADF